MSMTSETSSQEETARVIATALRAMKDWCQGADFAVLDHLISTALAEAERIENEPLHRLQ